MKPTNASSGSSTLALKKAESADLPTDPMDSSENVELDVVFEKKKFKIRDICILLGTLAKNYERNLKLSINLVTQV